jgi:hypothetical protein
MLEVLSLETTTRRLSLSSAQRVSLLPSSARIMSQDTPAPLPTKIKLKAPSMSMMGVDPSMILSGQKRRRTDSSHDVSSHVATPSRSSSGMKGEDPVAVGEMGRRLIEALKAEVDG